MMLTIRYEPRHTAIIDKYRGRHVTHDDDLGDAILDMITSWWSGISGFEHVFDEDVKRYVDKSLRSHFGHWNGYKLNLEVLMVWSFKHHSALASLWR